MKKYFYTKKEEREKDILFVLICGLLVIAAIVIMVGVIWISTIIWNSIEFSIKRGEVREVLLFYGVIVLMIATPIMIKLVKKGRK